MAKVIQKFNLKVTAAQEVEIPVGSTLLSIQNNYQNQTPILWALVCDKEEEKEVIMLRTIKTSDPISDTDFGGEGYLGTYQLNDSSGARHVFKMPF